MTKYPSDQLPTPDNDNNSDNPSALEPPAGGLSWGPQPEGAVFKHTSASLDELYHRRYGYGTDYVEPFKWP